MGRRNRKRDEQEAMEEIKEEKKVQERNGRKEKRNKKGTKVLIICMCVYIHIYFLNEESTAIFYMESILKISTFFSLYPVCCTELWKWGAFLNLENLIPQSCGFSMVKFHGL